MTRKAVQLVIGEGIASDIVRARLLSGMPLETIPKLKSYLENLSPNDRQALTDAARYTSTWPEFAAEIEIYCAKQYPESAVPLGSGMRK